MFMNLGKYTIIQNIVIFHYDFDFKSFSYLFLLVLVKLKKVFFIIYFNSKLNDTNINKKFIQ
jgi:hypothetical protein